MVKVLGLDVSTRSTGWFVTKRSCGTINPPKELSFEEKLVFFRRELVLLLERYKPDVVVIEDAYFRQGFGSIHTLKALVKFAGVASEVSCSHGAKVEIITASAARKHRCGDQENPFKKAEVFKYFKEKYDLDWTFAKGNDITDAMALLWGYREIQKLKSKDAKK